MLDHLSRIPNNDTVITGLTGPLTGEKSTPVSPNKLI